MINESGHDSNTDWWALGVIIYEMLIGIPPFYDKNRAKMFLKIKKKQPKYPDLEIHKFCISDVAKDLIQKLLEKDKDKRLGAKHDMNEVLSHKFFDGIDVDDLMDKKIKPPFIPTLDENDKLDVSNFDEQYTNCEAKESIIDNDMKERIINKVKAYIEDFDQIVDY